MPNYYIWTIGCQMNKAESERLAGYLDHQGYQSSPDVAGADLILVNSCVVRQSAETKVIHKLQALRAIKQTRPHVLIALTGCLVGEDTGQLREAFPHVDYFFPAGEFPAFLGRAAGEEKLPAHPAVVEYVPIMQGCNNFCSYCIVPYRRGRERSRPIVEIIREVEELVRRGVKEVTLLGQNVDSYGHDLPDKPDLADLLHQLDHVEGLLRVRFLTNHPKDMQPKLIEAVASVDKVCEQLNLPVQAGDNDILRAMRRGYTVEHYRSLIAEIRTRIPDIALSTDVIVGFPGETAGGFQNTYDLLSELRFDMVHVAAYSPRPETLAAREMQDDVPQAVKRERLNKIDGLQSRIAAEINSLMDGKVVEVLVEGRKKGRWFGRARSDKLVFFSDTRDWMGKLVDIRITHTSPWSLSGEVV